MIEKNDFSFALYEQKFHVEFDYPVYFTHSLFENDNPLLASVIDRKGGNHPHRIVIYIDSGVTEARPRLLKRIEKYIRSRKELLHLVMPPQIIGGGEIAKSGWSDVRKVMTELGDSHMDRQSFVLAVGGGSLLDMVGFATSLVHRGLRFIRVPTTVLSQNDAGVGVKNGMNERETKNYVGSFAPPFAVINDYDFLKTLKQKDWTGGIAEAFKVAIIKDADYFEFLCTNASRLEKRSMTAMKELIHRCAVLHLDHIRNEGDPFEFGSSRPLDFGHWSAHRLEAMSGFAIGHGQAVAMGIALDSYYAKETGLITAEELDRIITGMVDCGLPVWSPFMDKRDSQGKLKIIGGLEQFREHLGGVLTLAMPHSIGNKCEINEMNPEIIEAGIRFLSERMNRS